jgi:hypothetical protein
VSLLMLLAGDFDVTGVEIESGASVAAVMAKRARRSGSQLSLVV